MDTAIDAPEAHPFELNGRSLSASLLIGPLHDRHFSIPASPALLPRPESHSP